MKTFEIIKDFMGWTVITKDVNSNNSEIDRGFMSQQDAENFVEKLQKEQHKGSGIYGNEI